MKHSHSSVNRYTDCAMSWKLHYQEKLRSKVTSSALLFGTALDKALETYVTTRDKEKTLKTLHETWEQQEINKVPTKLANFTKIAYANSDFDEDLLTSVDKLHLEATYKVDNALIELESIYTQKDVIGFDMLKKERKELLNEANWLCLKHKGELMVTEAIKILDENMLELLGTQVLVKLENDTGDEVVGYADAVVRWKGYEKPIILDFKTSARLYDRDSVLKSHQLALYVNGLTELYENTRFGGYLVLHKGIKKNRTKICGVCKYDGSGARHKTCSNEIEGKRCGGEWIETLKPEATSQVIIDAIPPRLEEIVVENMESVNLAIKTGIFPRNLQSCEKPWGSCAFRDICFHNKYDKVIKLE